MAFEIIILNVSNGSKNCAHLSQFRYPKNVIETMMNERK